MQPKTNSSKAATRIQAHTRGRQVRARSSNTRSPNTRKYKLTQNQAACQYYKSRKSGKHVSILELVKNVQEQFYVFFKEFVKYFVARFRTFLYSDYGVLVREFLSYKPTRDVARQMFLESAYSVFGFESPFDELYLYANDGSYEDTEKFANKLLNILKDIGDKKQATEIAVDKLICKEYNKIIANTINLYRNHDLSKSWLEETYNHGRIGRHIYSGRPSRSYELSFNASNKSKVNLAIKKTYGFRVVRNLKIRLRKFKQCAALRVCRNRGVPNNVGALIRKQI